jgi:diaminopimelate epimerase
MTMTLKFRKMNGLGNDFAVFDARARAVAFTGDQARRIADRRTSVGCDQIIIIEPSQRANALMRILNADGSEVSACGNATRCIAGLLSNELGQPRITIETAAGVLLAEARADGLVTVDMGEPRFGWRDIPLAREMDTAIMDFSAAPGLEGPGAVNVGNPHCIFWVDDAGAHDLAVIGPRIEHDPLFPERVNVSLARITSGAAMTLRVWERGAGLTKACGTAACAAAVAAARLGLTGRDVIVTLPGGDLSIHWRECDNRITMTGPWSLDYEGELDAATLSPLLRRSA